MGGRFWLPLLASGCIAGGGGAPDGPILGQDTESTGPQPTTSVGATTQAPPGGTTTSTSTTTPPGTDASDSTASPTTGEACVTPVTWYRDQDEDGYGDPGETMDACDAPPGYVDDATDCDDGDENVNPGAIEPCGGPDLDCDFVAPALCRSCLELLSGGVGIDNGIYSIDPDGDDGDLPVQQMYCDMTTDGGGWTLVQRTVWDPAQTDAMRTGFASWRDATLGTANAGQGYRLSGATWPELNAQLEILLRLDVRQEMDGESCDPLFYLGSNATIVVDAMTAWVTGLEADVPMLAGTELSTYDSGPSIACLTGADAIPWFYTACCSTCPAYTGGYWTERHPMFNYESVPDLSGNTTAEVCSGPAEPAINGSVFRGVNSMEYYLR